VALALALCAATAGGQDGVPGSIRGAVTDKDFDVPVGGAQVTLVETGQKATTSDQGLYVIPQIAPGRYTVAITKDGFLRQVRAEVVVNPGQLTDLDVALEGEFDEMEELVVQDIHEEEELKGSEASLLQVRLESPALLDAVGADLIGRAGASDAAAAVRLVAGVSLQDGKSAVVRGLPDRYVSSQMNGVRLPTADEDKRAVELDQFPAAVIESIQVSKTFTPDQQGDASGGAVDVRLKGVPDQPWFFKVSGQVGFNSQVAGSDFLTYDGGGVSCLGRDDGDRDQQLGNVGFNWEGAAGVDRGSPPTDYKWSMSGGGRHELGRGFAIGGALSLFYERDSSFYDDGVDDSYWVRAPGQPMTPRTIQGAPSLGDFKTALFDVTQGKETVQWGTLATVGIENEYNELSVTYLYTRTAEDTATLAEDTRGKEYYFPGHDPDDPTTPGHDELLAAPYLRLETLDYTERTTQTLQFHGRHTLAWGRDWAPRRSSWFHLLDPEVDWSLAFSSATLDQPDKRQFGSQWFPAQQIGEFTIPAVHTSYKPDANFTIGNFQRIWKEIEEVSTQQSLDVKLPFEQWTRTEGYFKTGWFRDQVDRTFDQDTFSNFGDTGAGYQGDFHDLWSRVFPTQDHPITASSNDVDYEGEQKISAIYAMLDVPLNPELKLIGGARLESTKIGIVNDAEDEATWFPPGATAPVELNPGDADVDFRQDDLLPSIALEYKPWESVTLRAAYNETIARQTFKELTPILQSEFLGGDVFIGNPELQMSAVKNYDLRADWVPYDGGLLSASFFHKSLKDPIEYVQRLGTFDYTTAVNYPEGELTGFEFEVRQDLGHFWEPLKGLTAGANVTLIDSKVTLPDDEAAAFADPTILAPMTSRDMTNAPEYLYNLFFTYDVEATGTQIGLFYTVQGDTLLAGAGAATGFLVPSIYAKAYGTLNFSLTQKFGDVFKLQFQAKNLTNPEIETVYRSKYIGDDVLNTSYTQGIDLSLTLSAEFRF
jgi:outer membrane receptor protein involved in Fe transport